MRQLIICFLLFTVTTMSFAQVVSTDKACMHYPTEQVCDVIDCETKHSFTDNCCPESMMRHCYSPSITVIYSEQSTVPAIEKLTSSSSSDLDTNVKEKHSLSLFRPPIFTSN